MGLFYGLQTSTCIFTCILGSEKTWWLSPLCASSTIRYEVSINVLLNLCKMITNLAHRFDMSPSSQQGRLDMCRGVLWCMRYGRISLISNCGRQRDIMHDYILRTAAVCDRCIADASSIFPCPSKVPQHMILTKDAEPEM
jgi:hypothetical protein